MIAVIDKYDTKNGLENKLENLWLNLTTALLCLSILSHQIEKYGFLQGILMPSFFSLSSVQVQTAISLGHE